MRSHVQPLVPNLEDIRELRIEADAIESTYGPNAYSAYLRKYSKRPNQKEAAGIGHILGGRVRADDGTMQPLRKKPRSIGQCKKQQTA